MARDRSGSRSCDDDRPVSRRRRSLFRRPCRHVRRADEPPDRADRAPGADRTERQAGAGRPRARQRDRPAVARRRHRDFRPDPRKIQRVDGPRPGRNRRDKKPGASVGNRRPQAAQRAGHRCPDRSRQFGGCAKGHAPTKARGFPASACRRRSSARQRTNPSPTRSPTGWTCRPICWTQLVRKATATGHGSACWRTPGRRCASESHGCWPRFPVRSPFAAWRRTAPGGAMARHDPARLDPDFAMRRVRQYRGTDRCARDRLQAAGEGRQESDSAAVGRGHAGCSARLAAWDGRSCRSVLTVTMPAKTKTPNDIKALFAKFIKLSAADVQRAIRFIEPARQSRTRRAVEDSSRHERHRARRSAATITSAGRSGHRSCGRISASSGLVTAPSHQTA